MDIHSVWQQLKARSIYDLPLRVAFSESDEQLNSLGNQIQCSKSLIRKNARTYVEGYIDEGLSAAATKNRGNFHQMVKGGNKGSLTLSSPKRSPVLPETRWTPSGIPAVCFRLGWGSSSKTKISIRWTRTVSCALPLCQASPKMSCASSAAG